MLIKKKKALRVLLPVCKTLAQFIATVSFFLPKIKWNIFSLTVVSTTLFKQRTCMAIPRLFLKFSSVQKNARFNLFTNSKRRRKSALILRVSCCVA